MASIYGERAVYKLAGARRLENEAQMDETDVFHAVGVAQKEEGQSSALETHGSIPSPACTVTAATPEAGLPLQAHLQSEPVQGHPGYERTGLRHPKSSVYSTSQLLPVSVRGVARARPTRALCLPL